MHFEGAWKGRQYKNPDLNEHKSNLQIGCFSGNERDRRRETRFVAARV